MRTSCTSTNRFGRMTSVIGAVLAVSGCSLLPISDQDADMVNVRNDSGTDLTIQYEGLRGAEDLDSGQFAVVHRSCEFDTLVAYDSAGEVFARLTDSELCEAILVVVRGKGDMAVDVTR